jgi:DNA repair protein RadC
MKPIFVKLIFSEKLSEKDLFPVTCSESCVQYARTCWDEDNMEICEEFKVMFLNKANNVLGVSEISKGGISGTVVDLKLIFSAALNCLASAIVLVHNHPSGNLKPSLQDQKLTNKIVEASKLLDIEVLDHIILTPNSYYSFADSGILN